LGCENYLTFKKNIYICFCKYQKETRVSWPVIDVDFALEQERVRPKNHQISRALNEEDRGVFF